MPDYKAILTGQSWNATPTLSGPQKPVFLTYAFPSPAIFSWLDEEAFSASDRQVARKALKMWGDASGITFLEVSGQDAEIRFLWKESDRSASAWAEFPDLRSTGAGLVRDAIGGEVNLNTTYRDTINGNASFKLYLLLHEIGHALGLKHPFHTSPYNTQLLGDDLDHVSHTVMAYDGGDLSLTEITLGDLDLRAIHALYGTSAKDGQEVARWGWDGKRQLLSQAGNARNDTILGVASKDLMQGNKGNDKLYGFEGADTLAGGLGNDVLAGGDGADRFRFDTALSARKNIDRILDFDNSFDDDRIALSHKIFKGLAKGHLAERAFAVEGMRTDSSDEWVDWDAPIVPRPVHPLTEATRIIFNETTRYVSYDADGSGPTARIQFAKLPGTFSLDTSDFFIV